MSQSAIFNLVLRDQRFDDFFTASDFLRERIRRIQAKRRSAGMPNPLPTWTELAQSHIMYLRCNYRPYVAVSSEYVRVGPSGDTTVGANGGVAEFKFPVFGHFTSDMVLHVRFADVGTANPVISQNPGAGSPRYRYCAYPGIRMLSRVELKSDAILIDDYTADEVSFVNKFRIPADRRAAWDRGLGQAPVRAAEFFNNNGYTGVMHYKDGLQTLKFHHPTQDMWIPLQFWMCGDPSTALLNDLVPNTQRTVTAHIAPLADLLQAVDQVSGEPVPLPITTLGLQIDLYVNNLFVNPEIHDIFASRVGMSLIRVHRRQTKALNKSVDSILLDQLKFPAEYLYVGIRDRANRANFDQWHLFGRARERVDATQLLAPAAIWNSALAMCQLVCRAATETSSLEPITQELRLTAHGIDLFPTNMPASFFADYIPQKYLGNTCIVAPEDSSAMLVSFCLYPGKHNPSGYYNLSTGRELYIAYRADTIDATHKAELVVTMSALNFLIRKGDSCRLKYSV